MATLTRTLTLCAAIGLVLLGGGCEAERQEMTPEELEAFATRYAAAWSSQDPSALAAFYSEDGSLTVNGGAPAVGRDAVDAAARSFMTAFPDMAVRMVGVRRDHGRVIFRWRWTGTNTGPGGTGKAVDIEGYEQWTFSPDGLIADSDGHYDESEYQRQVGGGGNPN